VTADYGIRRRGRSAFAVLGGALLGIGAVTFVAWEARDWLQRRDASVELSETWSLAGPPCAELSAAEFRSRGLKTPKAFEFEGVVMARRYGHVTCAMVHTNGGRGFGAFPVCQFTGPGALHVVTPQGEAWFETGVGRPATISTEAGKPRCVLASRFRLENGRLTDG
jgi:hypothetical protein